MDDAAAPAAPPRSRPLVRILISSATSFGALAILNLLLPLWLGVDDFGRWRQIALVLTLAGIAHLGIAEGLYLWWIQRPRARMSRAALLRNLAIVVAVAGVFSTIACATGSVRWADLPLVWTVVATCATYAMALSWVQTHSDHPRYISMFVMQPVSMAVLVATLGLTDLATPATTALAMASSYLIATLHITLTGRIVGGSQVQPDESLRTLLVTPHRGLVLLGSSVLFILVLNIDKFVFNQRFDHTEFASYSLLAVVPTALFSLAGPVGTVLFARGALTRRRRTAVLGLALLAIVAGEIVARLLAPVLAGWYDGFDIDALPWFTRWSGLSLALAVYYLPRLRVVHARAFTISLGVYAVAAAAVSALVPADLLDSPIASVAAVNVGLLALWLVSLDVLDARRTTAAEPDPAQALGERDVAS